MAINIEYVDKLHPIFTKPKRIKIIVGGRGSTKSTGIADYVAAQMTIGKLWCCAREHQNSIEESVHRTILGEIERLGFSGFTETKTNIYHNSGGRNFYKGIARNITSLKSTLSGIDGLWIEEGEDSSKETVRILTASVRLNAADTQRKIQGEDIKMPEIIITMNRGSRSGAVAEKWLARAEKDLDRCGYYEDDLLMIVEMNYTDMPGEWFINSGLEEERRDDKERMSVSEYDSKWLGKYLETVDNAIIKPEWFDACIDAHKIERLVEAFNPKGVVVASHDPSDEGVDSKGFALRAGSIIKIVKEKLDGEIDDGCDWAIDEALKYKADWFIWDGDGMGAGLKRQVAQGLDGKRIDYHMFRGSLSGKAQDNAHKKYMSEDHKAAKSYMDTFKNNRSQYYIDLSNRCYATYRCVVRNEYVDPDEMISFDSEGIDNMVGLRSEICRIPRKKNNVGLQQIMSKDDMKKLKINSPNMADSVMMSLYNPAIKPDKKIATIIPTVHHWRS